MTERCQVKFAKKNNNKNYYLYVSVIVLFISVLYCYGFLFAAICFGYAFGGFACYLALNSNIVNEAIENLKNKYVQCSTIEVEEETNRGCTTCGLKECPRHDGGVASDPWVGLKIHKQLDQAIEEFYNTILENFVSSWYSKITLQPFFLDELRHQLRYASACLLRRAIKINYSRFITERLIPCALHHYTVCAGQGERGRLPAAGKMAVHPAAANRTAELTYLRSITNAIMPYLLRTNDLQNSVFRVLVRELFSGWVLLSLTDVLADPRVLNTLVILATGDETMAKLPEAPDYTVEFLETFARQTDSIYIQRGRLLRCELESVLEDQQMFYAFLTHLKTTCHLQLLQFYKDINAFQTKLLNPALCDKEKSLIIREARDIYTTYFNPQSPSRVDLDPALVEEMKCLLDDSEDCIRNLQTSKALYQAARQSHAVLECVMLPRFLHSEEFYNLHVGQRVPTGYHKQMTKKPQDRLIQSALKLSNKLRTSKSHISDGEVLDSIPSDLIDGDTDNVDILKYLDYLASEDSLKELDLSSYKVVLTDVENVMQVPPRRGSVRVFSLAVSRASAALTSAPALLCTRRSEHDFHLLRGKLIEFHRHLEMGPLPSRRDNSPLETLRYKYEDYLQRLLEQPILQTSELLHLFLTAEGDFSLAVQALSLTNSTDLLNIYQSVAHRLKKEKGQHLDSFLRNFIVSSDVERYQEVLKNSSSQAEEAQEVNEEVVKDIKTLPKKRNARDITTGVFGDNFNIQPTVYLNNGEVQNTIVGFTQCFMYILIKVVEAPSIVCGVVGAILARCRLVLDSLFNLVLNNLLTTVLCQRRLAHLIRLGQGLIFGKSPSPKLDWSSREQKARAQLLSSVPNTLTTLCGLKIQDAVEKAFDILQEPRLNKQLVYELLDLCLSELFPELVPDCTETPR